MAYGYFLRDTNGPARPMFGELVSPVVSKWKQPQLQLTTKTCDTDRFMSCLVPYAHSLGFRGGLPPDAQTFITQLIMIQLQQGVNGLILICRSGTALRTCMPTQYETCINVPNLVHMGLSIASATTYTATVAQLNYECGPGLSVFLNQYTCMMSAFINNSTFLQQCQNYYTKNVQNDPVGICRYTNIFMTCYSAPYGNSCGKVVGEAVCGSMMASFRASIPFCWGKLTCSLLPTMKK